MKTLLIIALLCVTGNVYAKQSQCYWVNGAYQCYNPYNHYNGYNNNSWSDGEKVIAGLLLINTVAQYSKPQPDPVTEAYKAGVRARQLEHQQRAAERAYMCGYTGTCGDKP
jgi:hypothetical protein